MGRHTSLLMKAAVAAVESGWTVGKAATKFSVRYNSLWNKTKKGKKGSKKWETVDHSSPKLSTESRKILPKPSPPAMTTVAASSCGQMHAGRYVSNIVSTRNMLQFQLKYTDSDDLVWVNADEIINSHNKLQELVVNGEISPTTLTKPGPWRMELESNGSLVPSSAVARSSEGTTSANRSRRVKRDLNAADFSDPDFSVSMSGSPLKAAKASALTTPRQSERLSARATSLGSASSVEIFGQSSVPFSSESQKQPDIKDISSEFLEPHHNSESQTKTGTKLSRKNLRNRNRVPSSSPELALVESPLSDRSSSALVGRQISPEIGLEKPAAAAVAEKERPTESVTISELDGGVAVPESLNGGGGTAALLGPLRALYSNEENADNRSWDSLTNAVPAKLETVPRRASTQHHDHDYAVAPTEETRPGSAVESRFGSLILRRRTGSPEVSCDERGFGKEELPEQTKKVYQITPNSKKPKPSRPIKPHTAKRAKSHSQTPSIGPSTSMVSSVEEKFEVERILASRKTRNGTLFYLVKWKGFGEGSNSWENDMEGAKDVVLDFNLEFGPLAKGERSRYTDEGRAWDAAHLDQRPEFLLGLK